MRLLYSIAWWLAMPLVLGRAWLRGRREPGYRQHLAERFGLYRNTPAKPPQPLIWVHAVSLGETRGAEPLIDALLGAYPHHAILLTHMTPTGRAAGKALVEKHGQRLIQCYLPYDTGWMAGRFLAHFAPQICILMETEVWPNLTHQCVKRAVPVALVSARLSERSLAKALKLAPLMAKAAQALSCVAAQTEADAERLRQLGIRDVRVTGSIKFDVVPPEPAVMNGAELRARIGQRSVLLCASTREGEEELILDQLKLTGLADTLVVIVPRHPQRFDEVARMIEAKNLSMRRRSQLNQAGLSPDIKILLGDTMGEMFAYYAACDIAFVGGSLLPLGGQNLIESCALGKPVLTGPHTFNFNAITEDAIAAGAAIRVQDAEAMLHEAQRLLGTERELADRGLKAMAFARQHRGATARTMDLLAPLLQRRK